MNLFPLLVPAGNDTEVQYNDSGIFGGDSSFTFNDTTKIVDMDGLTLTGTTAIGLDMTGTFSTAAIVIPDGDFIGSVSDPDAIQIEADGDIVMSQDLAVSGTLDVTGHVGIATASAADVVLKAYETHAADENFWALDAVVTQSGATTGTIVGGRLGAVDTHAAGNVALVYGYQCLAQSQTNAATGSIYGIFGGGSVADGFTPTITAVIGAQLTADINDATVTFGIPIWAAAPTKDAGSIAYAVSGYFEGPTSGTTQNASIVAGGDIQMTSNTKLILEGGFAVPGDSYLLYDAAGTTLDCFVNATEVWNANTTTFTVPIAAHIGGAVNYTDVQADGDIVQNGTGRFFESFKFKCTAIGGFAVKLTNTTGANTVAGQLVKADTATDDAVILTAAGDVECFGVFLDSGVADDAEAWVVVSGIADVAMEDDTAATHGNWVETSDAEAGYANAESASPAAAPAHFEEIGHCIESVAAGGGGTHILARCILHFN